MKNNSGIADIIVDKNPIDDETFNRGNIIANFEEYLSLNSIGMSNFINYEDKSGSGREFFITASIFSKKLDEILKAFDEKIINSDDFIKIKEKDKNFIKEIGKTRAFKKFKKSKKNRNIRPGFENTINMMYKMKQMAREDTENLKEYDELLLKIIPNLEATVKNLGIIEKAIETIEKG